MLTRCSEAKWFRFRFVLIQQSIMVEQAVELIVSFGFVLLQIKQSMTVEQDEERIISRVALEYTRLMLRNLTDNINTFK